MARPLDRALKALRRLPHFGIVVGLCMLIALLVPARSQLPLTTPLAALVEFVVTPISGPANRLVRWLRPVPTPPSSAELGVLQQENALLKTQLLAIQSDNSRLRELLEQQRVLVGSGPAGLDQLPAAVVATSSDLASPALTVRAGQREGVEVGTVATVDFVHLFGRVASVRARTSTIIPITAKGSEQMSAVVTLGNGRTLLTQLAASGDGSLVGLLEDQRDASNQAVLPAVGNDVRLADTSRWPRDAQMLLIGKVVSIGPAPAQPLRSQIVVRPAPGDLARVREVVLRIPPPPPGGRGALPRGAP
jgi:cell shape-determining protein MreC